MNARQTVRALSHLMLADARERMRRYSFLVTLGVAVLLGYLVCTGKIKLWLGDVRGIYDSAWVGVLMALVCNTFLALSGFYIVKSSVDRDRITGVGEILATTPMTRFQYALGKAGSNYLVLLSMAAVLALAAPVGQLVAGEDRHLQIWPLVSPFLFLVLPALALVAALAVLFEMVPGLRGVFGNFAWFFLWTSGLTAAISGRGLPDPFGFARISEDMFREKEAIFGAYSRSFVLGAILNERQARLFRWRGLEWSATDGGHALVWLGVAIGVAFVASLFFDRFDRQRQGGGASVRASRRERKRAAKAARAGADGAIIATPGAVGAAADEAFLVTRLPPAPLAVAAIPTLAPLPREARRFRFFDLWRAELRLALQGQRWWWHLVLAGLTIAAIFAPLEGVKKFVLPFLWFWPIAIWSGLGSREERFGTTPLVLSGARPLWRQLPAAWLAGVAVAAVCGAMPLVRFVLAGDRGAVGAWLVGALFIPTFALACGVWSGSGKLFEVLYFILWYLGALEQVPACDYLGAVAAAQKQGMPLVYLVFTLLLGVAGVAGRRRQLAGAQG